MKKLILILSFSLFGSSLTFGQTTIQEQYFHELKGMEDSSGVTHLFYRKYVTSTFQCSEENGGDLVDYQNNNVFHFDISSQSDSLVFSDYYGEWCLDGNYDSKSTHSYSFYESDPNKWITNSSYEYSYGISDYAGNVLDFKTPIAIKRKNEAGSSSYLPKDLLLSPKGDSLYVKTFSDVIIPFPGHGENWPVFEDHDMFKEYADSLIIEWNIIDIHPEIDSLNFANNSSGDLYRSTRYSSNFTFADSSTNFSELFFDADTSHIYTVASSGILRSDDLGQQGSWTSIEVDFETRSTKFLALDSSISGNLFVSDSTNILFSNNYGDFFTSFTSIENEITGLYKKPASNLLYALTRKELLEINTETKAVTSLKNISVSNEPRPSEIPKQVSLHQNYPNPFNPSTVISYQLAGNSLVQLEVFDVTGRKVAVLVDGERKSIGNHRVKFDGTGLSSGMYFYRLTTGGQTLTRKMLLMK